MMRPSRYKINPVKATLKKLDEGRCGMQALNNTCFGICGAFSGTTDVWNMDPACTKACESLINDARYRDYGVGKCDHQAPQRPVLWGQVPHYLPQVLNRGFSPKKSLKICKEMCKEMMPGNDECIGHCQTDYDAIVEPYMATPPPPTLRKINFDNYEKSHPTAFWIGFSVVMVAIIVIIVMLVRYRK